MKQTQESLSVSYRFFLGVIGKWGFDVKGTSFIDLIGGFLFMPQVDFINPNRRLGRSRKIENGSSL